MGRDAARDSAGEGGEAHPGRFMKLSMKLAWPPESSFAGRKP